MRNATEKAIKIGLIAVAIIFAIIMLTSCKLGAQVTYGPIGEKTYMLSTGPGEIRVALMTPDYKNDPHGYRIGDAKSIDYTYDGTPAMILEMIAEEYTLAGLSFPCFCDAIGSGQTPAALQYYERCHEIRNFVNSLK